jgi:hypothetical protein
MVQWDLRLTEFIAAGAVGHVFRGVLTTVHEHTVVAKWAQDKGCKGQLLQEARVYKILSNLQGRMIPKVYGLFKDGGALCLLTEWMGHSIATFADLSTTQAYAIFFAFYPVIQGCSLWGFFFKIARHFPAL